MKHKNLFLIGTSHIAKESLMDVEKGVKEYDPEMVAIELDRKRLYALLYEKHRGVRISDIRRIGFKGYLFSLIGAWAEKKLGEYVGVAPGSEMLLAVKLARKKKVPLCLVDQDIEITLRKLSKAITWREKWNFVVDVFGGVFKKQEFGFDLRTVPGKEVIKKLTDQVKKRYPSIYNVLVTERNVIMAVRLARLMELHPDKRIMAVVGAGHEEEIIRIVKKELAKKKAATLSIL